MISFSDSFLVILDNDKEGRGACKKYLKCFKDSFEKNYYMYDFSKDNKFELEDLLSEQDREQIKNITGCNDVKSAINVLFFMPEEEKAKFINHLDKDTKSNLKIVEEKIKSHFKLKS